MEFNLYYQGQTVIFKEIIQMYEQQESKSDNPSLFSSTYDTSKEAEQDPHKSYSAPPNRHNFTVGVRIKPKEHQQDNLKIFINKNHKEMSIQTHKYMRNSAYGGKCKSFKMDAIFEESATNNSIFQSTVKQKLSLLKKNMNIALMAYGATNSGKTYTILGSTKQQQGLAHLSYKYLLESLFKGSYKFYFSYLQIYNQNVQDLLSEKQKRHNLNIFQDHTGKVNIPQLTRIQVQSYYHLRELIEVGTQVRVESSNNINKLSSRSHAILQLEIFSVQDIDNEISEVPVDVNFMIIDLAGSEKSTPYFQQSQQLTLKQGSNINRSLLALGNCIKNLSSGESHIPYRNSKLTRLLKDNLSGSCHNIMIACISHASSQFQQSISTLQYASKACRIEISDKNTKGKDRGKHVGITCEHCKMGIDFGAVCQVLKANAFQVVDLLSQTKQPPRNCSIVQVNKRQVRSSLWEQNMLTNYLDTLKHLCNKPQNLELLGKFIDNLQNINPKVQIHIQQTDDSHRDYTTKYGQISLKLKLKQKPTQNPHKNQSKHLLNQSQHQRNSKSRSQKPIRLTLKDTSKQKPSNKIKQSSLSKTFIRVQQPSFNVSTINSRKQQYLLLNHQQQNPIQPFIPQLSLDLSSYYHPSKTDRNYLDKDFQSIQFIKNKRSSEPVTLAYNKQNGIYLANHPQDEHSLTSRDQKNNEKTHNFGKCARRMKQDPTPYFAISQNNCEKGEKEVKSKIKLVTRLR